MDLYEWKMNRFYHKMDLLKLEMDPYKPNKWIFLSSKGIFSSEKGQFQLQIAYKMPRHAVLVIKIDLTPQKTISSVMALECNVDF